MSDRLGKPDSIILRYVPDGAEFVPVIRDDYGREQKVVWAPLPGSQRMFLNAPEFEALYEGTRGPGKTLSLIMDFCQDVGKGRGAEWKGMIIRQTYPQLNDVITMSKKWIKRIWPDAFYNEIKSFWQWPTGELLYFRPIMVEADYWQHHGTNYSWLGWEELTTWPNDKPFKKMFSVVRSTMRGIPLRVRATTNPYGIGHNWVRARYGLIDWPVKIGTDPRAADPALKDLWKILGPLIDNSVDDAGVPEPPRRAYHGSLRENILMMKVDPGYVQRLRASASNQSELDAWLYGSWAIAAGGMFDDIWHSHRSTILVGEFEIPATWRIVRAYDHGSGKPWSVGYYAESDGSDIEWVDKITGKTVTRSTLRGDLFRVGELYGNQAGRENEGRRMTIAEIKREIIEYEISRGWRDPLAGKTRVRRGPADTSIFDTQDDGRPSIANEFELPIVVDGHRWRGIIWERADKGPGSREQGWQQCREALKATRREPGQVRERRGLFIVDGRNPNWVRTVPELPRDEKKIDDVDTESEDHIGDEMRYMLRYENPTIKTRRF